jgi:hypothetical protein
MCDVIAYRFREKGADVFDECLVHWLRENGNTTPLPSFLQTAVEWYNRRFSDQSQGLQAQLAEVESELTRIAEAIAGGIPPPCPPPANRRRFFPGRSPLTFFPAHS